MMEDVDEVIDFSVDSGLTLSLDDDEDVLPDEAVRTLPIVKAGAAPVVMEYSEKPVSLKKELTLVEKPSVLFDFGETSLSPLQQMYIMRYLSSGNKVKACQAIEVSMHTVNKWLKNKDFAEAMQIATDAMVDVLEEEAMRRALDSSDKLLIAMLKAMKPEKYADRKVTDAHVSGEIVHSWADLAEKASKLIESPGYTVEEDE